MKNNTFQSIELPYNCARLKKKDYFAYVLDDVISREECASWIERSSPLLKYITQAKHRIENSSDEYMTIDLINPRKYRLALLNDPVFTDHLWSQIQSRIKGPLDAFMRKEGLSHCTGLNPRLRVLHYSNLDRFEPHYDQTVENEAGWSRITVLLYLNDDFEFGQTVFLNPLEIQQDDTGQFVSGHCILPQIGRVILFQHDLYHSGAQLREPSANKYIMRTEIMFEKMTRRSCEDENPILGPQTLDALLKTLNLEEISDPIQEATGVPCASATVDSVKSIGLNLLTRLFSETNIDVEKQAVLLSALFRP